MLLLQGPLRFVTIQINTALKQGWEVLTGDTGFCNHSNQHSSKTQKKVRKIRKSFVTIQINTALKPFHYVFALSKSFVTIQISTALKPIKY